MTDSATDPRLIADKQGQVAQGQRPVVPSPARRRHDGAGNGASPAVSYPAPAITKTVSGPSPTVTV